MVSRAKMLYALIAIGLAISVYLTIAAEDTQLLVCPATGPVDCAAVITSQYSKVFNIPDSVVGAALFIVAPFMVVRHNDTLNFLWSVVGGGAVLYSLASMGLLGKICLWCSALDLVIVLVALISNYTGDGHDTGRIFTNVMGG